jgi:antitoxin component of MazEF toxin-antitoxin module
MPYLRRIYKQGNSLVISFPAWMLEQINVHRGDMVVVTYDKKGYLIIEKSQSELVPNASNKETEV